MGEVCVGLWHSETGWKKEIAIYSPCSKFKINPRQTGPYSTYTGSRSTYGSPKHTLYTAKGTYLECSSVLQALWWPECYLGNSVLPVAAYGVYQIPCHWTRKKKIQEWWLFLTAAKAVFSGVWVVHVVRRTLTLQVCELLWAPRLMNYLQIRMARWAGEPFVIHLYQTLKYTLGSWCLQPTEELGSVNVN